MSKKLRTNILYHFDRIDTYDPKQVAELARKCMGSRNEVTFAALCQVNPSTISRLLKGNNSYASADELIIRIYDQREDGCGVGFQEWMRANGYRNSHVQEDPELNRLQNYYFWEEASELAQRLEMEQNPANYWLDRIARCERILTDDLRARGFRVSSRTVRRYPDEYEGVLTYHAGLDLWTAPPFIGDVWLETDALEAENLTQWMFLIADPTNFENVMQYGLSSVYQMRPTEDHRTRVTFLATSERVFMTSAVRLSRSAGKLRDSLSVMKIDLKKERIDAECVPEREDGTAVVRLYPDGRVNGEYKHRIPADWN